VRIGRAHLLHAVAVRSFDRRLDETGAFKDLYSTDERPNDEGQIESALTMIYVPEAPK